MIPRDEAQLRSLIARLLEEFSEQLPDGHQVVVIEARNTNQPNRIAFTYRGYHEEFGWTEETQNADEMLAQAHSPVFQLEAIRREAAAKTAEAAQLSARADSLQRQLDSQQAT